jgi:N-acetylglucosaminyldiphosphoundecaprenol N-acetyl-beta-D-mannosaminyltransferase
MLTSSSPESDLPVVYFAGLRLHPLSVDETIAALDRRPATAPFASFVTPNIEHCYWVRKDPEHAACMAHAYISTNDSRVLGRAGAFAGLRLKFAPGAYVVADLFKKVIPTDEPITVIGGTPELIARFQAFSGHQTIHHHNPPMGFIHRPEAVTEAIDYVVAHPARFVFVAMGPPQSEKFCERLRKDGRATGIGLCIGSSLSVISGDSNPAPDFMENTGLVWLYRLATEPKRLWKRYLVRDTAGLWYAIVDIVRLRLGLKATRIEPSDG